MTLLNKTDRIYIAGHQGMVGSALVRCLKREGFNQLLTVERHECDLVDTAAVQAMMADLNPTVVFLAAARVGGILANSQQPASFIYDNLMIQNNVIHTSYLQGVQRLCFLGSSCIYPKMARQPIQESALLTGPLEPTNDAYAVAKIAGIKTCQSYNDQYGTRYISVMPTNLYGPGDNYHPQHSHVLPALLRKFHEAKQTGQPSVSVWGTGAPMREFLHADDCASACVYLMSTYVGNEPVNVGTGQDLSIRDLALLIRSVVGYTGELVFDTSKPDGTPKKQLDVTRLTQLGWTASIPLRQGIEAVYETFKKEEAAAY